MSEEIVKGQATYWGGLFLHPGNERGDAGDFLLMRDKIIFGKGAILSGNRWRIEIPMDKIIWGKISQQTGEDMAYKNKMTAYSYFARQGPMTSYSRNITFLTIPFTDEKGIEQSPKFTFNKPKVLEEISKFLYERMPSQNSGSSLSPLQESTLLKQVSGPTQRTCSSCGAIIAGTKKYC